MQRDLRVNLGVQTREGSRTSIRSVDQRNLRVHSVQACATAVRDGTLTRLVSLSLLRLHRHRPLLLLSTPAPLPVHDRTPQTGRKLRDCMYGL